MAIRVNLHDPKSADPQSHTASCGDFDTVTVNDSDGSSVSIFLTAGMGAMVADAINAAILHEKTIRFVPVHLPEMAQ